MKGNMKYGEIKICQELNESADLLFCNLYDLKKRKIYILQIQGMSKERK